MNHGGSRIQDSGGTQRGPRLPFYRWPSSGPRRAARMRVLGWVAVGLAFCLVAVSLTAYLKFRSVWDSIRRVDVTGLGIRPLKLNNSLNILLIGSDSRAGANRGFGAGITGQRSDTVIVLHIAPGAQRAVVLSIPRDSVVPVLSCPAEPGTAGQAALPGQVEQINATFAHGGPGCLWKTIEQTTHVRIDHFIELNFAGFEHVINDLGGVRICLPFAINDPQSNLRLSPGIHHVWGREGLAFWRARYIGEGSDLQRIQRDQFLMASILQGAERTSLLSSPTRMLAVISDVARSMTTDSGLSLSMLPRIVDSVRHLPPRSVQFVELPTEFYPPDPNWVQWPAVDSQLFSAIAHDRAIPRSARKIGPHSASALAESARLNLGVQLLNGAGITGLAQRAASSLTDRGVRVIHVGNASSFTHESSIIEYPTAADRRAAADLRSLLGAGMLQLAPALRPGTITVILGADYQARHRVAVGSAPVAAARAAAVTARTPGPPTNLTREFGGIPGNANVCGDSQAFVGPRGGA